MIATSPTTSPDARRSSARRRRALIVAPLLGGAMLVGAGLIGVAPASAATPTAAVGISVVDTLGNSAEFLQTLAEIGQQPGDKIGLVITVSNIATDSLKNLVISTEAAANSGGTVTNLTCTFPDSSTGTTWAGPFAPGGTFGCTAFLSLQFTTDGGTTAAANGTNVVVDATGVTANDPTANSDPYYAMEVPDSQIGGVPAQVNATQPTITPDAPSTTPAASTTPSTTSATASAAAASAAAVTTSAAITINTGSAGMPGGNSRLILIGSLLMVIGLMVFGWRVARTRLSVAADPRH